MRGIAALSVFAVMLGGAWPAQAVLLRDGDGSQNTTAPQTDPGWNNVGWRANGGAVLVGNGWVLSADHVPAGSVELNGITYPLVPGSVKSFASDFADLQIYRVHPLPPIAPVLVSSTAPAPGAAVILIGTGLNRGAPLTVNGISGFRWIANQRSKRWGTNTISSVSTSNLGVTLLHTTFDPPGTDTPDEAQATTYDSGGAMFVLDTSSGLWTLGGIMAAADTSCPQPAGGTCSLYGFRTSAINLARLYNQIEAKVSLSECEDGFDNDGDGDADLDDPGCRTGVSIIEDPACDDDIDNDSDGSIDSPADAQCFNHPWGISETGDADSDGDLDPVDNCSTYANATQTDTDSDSFGNRCDADFNQSGIVNFSDLAYFKTKFLTTDALTDLNSDGIVNFLDLAILKTLFLKPPGPGAQP